MEIECPRCHKSSPPEARKCWNCLAVLSAEPEPPQMIPLESAQQARLRRRYKAGKIVRVGAIGALIGAGWARGNARVVIFGAGLTIFGALRAGNRLGARKQKRLELDEDGPFEQTVDFILLHAIKAKAAAVRMVKLDYGVTTEHQIEGEWQLLPWREQSWAMLDMWSLLETEFAARARQGDIELSTHAAGWFQSSFALTPDELSARFSAQFLGEPRAEILLTRL